MEKWDVGPIIYSGSSSSSNVLSLLAPGKWAWKRKNSERKRAIWGAFSGLGPVRRLGGIFRRILERLGASWEVFGANFWDKRASDP